MEYTISFDRIGRNHNPPKLVTVALDHEELASLIRRHCRPHIASRSLDVAIEKDGKSGFLYCGFHIAGEFTVSSPSTHVEG